MAPPPSLVAGLDFLGDPGLGGMCKDRICRGIAAQRTVLLLKHLPRVGFNNQTTIQ